MKKKKVLFISPSLRQGGVEHSLIINLNLLDPQKYDITLYLYFDMLDLLPSVPKYVNVVIGIDHTKYFRKPYCIYCLLCYYIMRFLKNNDASLSFQRKMYAYIHKKKVTYPHRKFFRNQKFDIVISYCLHIGTEMGLEIPAKKYCVFMRSSDPNYHYKTAEKTFDKYNVIVCVSAGVKKVMSEAYPEYANKMIVIENYIDADRVRKLAEADMPIMIDSDLIISSCGRLSYEKGFDLAVEAAAVLKKENVSFQWLFIGDGSERSSLEVLINKYNLQDNITITGFTDNPFAIIKDSDIYVQPSYEESYGRTIKEAIVLGKPVVSTDTVGGETILEYGEKGVLTDFTGKAIAEGILSLINNPKKRQLLENWYTLEENKKEKQIYIDSFNMLLQE